MNYPADDPTASLSIDTSFLTSSDLLVVTTRPPLDDEVGGAKKRVLRSHTSLENQVVATLRAYFEVCSRDNVKLSRNLSEMLSEAFANRAHIIYRQNRGAAYKYLRRSEEDAWQEPGNPPRTALYLVHTPPIWPNGPQCLVVFGMGGPETLVWTYLLRIKYWRALQLGSPRFVMGEMTVGDFPPRPHTLSFADNWGVDFLLNIPLKSTAT